MNRADDRLLTHLEIFQVSPASHPWLCNFYNSLILGKGASQMAQRVKNTPAMQEMWVQSLGREDPPEEGMTTHSSILAWRIPWTEEPGGLQSTGSQSRTRLRS